MLSAMAASTGGPGTRPQPSVAPARVKLLGGCERRDSEEQSPRALHQEHKREHEQEVIEPGQDVFDPEDRVGRHDFQSTRAGPGDEAGVHRQNALELHGAVQAHEPREHVDPGFRELREEDGLPVEPFRHTDAPALHGDAAREGAAHRGQRLGAVGELRLHLERRGLVDRRDLPEDVVRLPVQLRELQVARLEFVRASRHHRGEQQRDSHEQERALSHGRSVGGFASMLTSYPPRILA